MINSIDEKIAFSQRHPNETIREILRYDSGYLKDLFIKNENLCFSRECFDEICRLTTGHKDNWEKPKDETLPFFSRLKTYASPYLTDFNDEELRKINENRLSFI